jgi:transposase
MEKEEMSKSGRKFSRLIALEAVRMVEEGFLRKEIREKFGLCSATLDQWMRLYGSEEYHQNKRKTYSKTEKRSILSAVNNGMSPREAQIAYGLKSIKIVHDWVRQSKQEKLDICIQADSMSKKENTEKPSEDVVALRRELELAKLKIEALNTLIDVAEDQLKIDIRKKSGAKRSSK